MANKRELHITIDPKGKVHVNVKCVPGAACTTTSEFLERAMGGKVSDRELTAEYYEANPGEGHCRKEGE
jgi:hypothetical protein